MTPQSVIDAGYLDALIRAIGGLSAKQVRETSGDYLRIVRSIREGSAFDRPGGWSAFREVAEQARLAVNRAKRLEQQGPTGTAPKQVPIPGEPGNPMSKRAEYSVIVLYRDPQTGGTARIPTVITDDAGLSNQQIATIAALAGVQDGSWSTSGVRGEIDPATAVYVDVIVIGIVGVR